MIRLENLVVRGENGGNQHLLLLTRSYRPFLCPCIDRLGAYSFWPVHLCVCVSVCLFVCLSAKTFTLSISFDWCVLRPSYFTQEYLVTRPFCWYQVQGHLSKSRSNIKVTVFKKWPLQEHWCLTNTSCFLRVVKI